MSKLQIGMIEFVRILTAFWTGVLVLHAGRYHPERKVLESCREFTGFLARKSRQSSWYLETRRQLCKRGGYFHFGPWMTPGVWLGMRIVTACVGFVVMSELSVLAGVICAMTFYYGADVLLWYLNKRDNERMLPEIRLIYHALEIRIRAGVYVADALAECYAGVNEKRLKQALLDLAGAITMKADVHDALDLFQGKFDNRYIDALCITITQALESGQAVELLGDIAEQVKDMEVTVLSQRKGALDRSITFYQLGILAAVLGMVLYACIMQMLEAAVLF